MWVHLLGAWIWLLFCLLAVMRGGDWMWINLALGSTTMGLMLLGAYRSRGRR